MSMDKKVKYLNANIPEAEKETKARSSVKSDDRMKEIEDSLAVLTDMMTKSNRDNLDAMYNIDMDNLSTSLKTLLKSYDDGITSAKADIETWATAQEAGFSAIATWQSGAESSMSRIEGKADANTASISVVSQLATETSTALASFSEYVEENYAETSMIASVTDSRGRVTAASIVAAVNDASSSVMIDADRILLDGETKITGKDRHNDEAIILSGNDIRLNLPPSETSSNAAIVFAYDMESTDSPMGAIMTKDYGSGESDDAKYALEIMAFDFIDKYDDRYYCALKMISAGNMSLESDGNIYMSADTSRTGNIAADSKIIALRPSLTYANATGIFPSTATNSGYVFCTDGIYYNGYRILQT